MDLGKKTIDEILDIIINQVNNKLMNETRLIDYIYKAHHFLTELESVPRNYGSEDLLYSSEIHTIIAVNKNPSCNLTKLACLLNVSSAAAFKFATKLVVQGYITKHKTADNMRDVLFDTTEKGKRVARGHAIFEKRTFAPLLLVEKKLSQEEHEIIEAYLKKLLESTP